MIKTVLGHHIYKRFTYKLESSTLEIIYWHYDS